MRSGLVADGISVVFQCAGSTAFVVGDLVVDISLIEGSRLIKLRRARRAWSAACLVSALLVSLSSSVTLSFFTSTRGLIVHRLVVAHHVVGERQHVLIF